MMCLSDVTRSVKRVIAPGDIVAMDRYAGQRQALRRHMVRYTQNRRMHIGPHCTLMFENFHTMLYQVHEMLYTEGNGRLDDELAAYNPLIPTGEALSATLMFAIADPGQRRTILSGLGGVEEMVYLRFGGHSVKARHDQDAARISADGKTSAVHFLDFSMTTAQARDFTRTDRAVVEIAHLGYSHMAVIPTAVKTAINLDI